MNVFYFHFGDYYHDGHGLSQTVCLQSPKTREEIQLIIDKVNFMHPALDNWECGLATRYEAPNIEPQLWKDIIALGYPIEQFLEKMDDCDLNCTSWDELASKFELEELNVTIDAVIDIYLFMLNHYGAELTEITEDHSNHFSFNYGYGCFWY